MAIGQFRSIDAWPPNSLGRLPNWACATRCRGLDRHVRANGWSSSNGPSLSSGFHHGCEVNTTIEHRCGRLTSTLDQN